MYEAAFVWWYRYCSLHVMRSFIVLWSSGAGRLGNKRWLPADLTHNDWTDRVVWSNGSLSWCWWFLRHHFTGFLSLSSLCTWCRVEWIPDGSNVLPDRCEVEEWFVLLWYIVRTVWGEFLISLRHRCADITVGLFWRGAYLKYMKGKKMNISASQTRFPQGV